MFSLQRPAAWLAVWGGQWQWECEWCHITWPRSQAPPSFLITCKWWWGPWNDGTIHLPHFCHYCELQRLVGGYLPYMAVSTHKEWLNCWESGERNPWKRGVQPGTQSGLFLLPQEDLVDPYFAHCKAHSNKDIIKRKVGVSRARWVCQEEGGNGMAIDPKVYTFSSNFSSIISCQNLICPLDPT